MRVRTVVVGLIMLMGLHVVYIEARRAPPFDNRWTFPRGFEERNEALEGEGFVHIRQCVGPDILRQFNDHVGKTDVDYHAMAAVLLGVRQCLYHQLGWRAVMTKYSVSNQDNRIDASFLHTDVKNLSRTNTPIPCYTVLLYGDGGRMQLIPSTHRRAHESLICAAIDLTRIMTIEVAPGDLMIINTSLIHRGLFWDVERDRRLMQIFEVYPNQATFDRFAPMVSTTHASESSRLRMLRAIHRKASLRPGVNAVTNMLMYINYRLGYQPQLNTTVPAEYDPMFASNEPRRRLQDLNDTTMNVYVPLIDACPLVKPGLRVCERP
jgi:hypothetical protein